MRQNAIKTKNSVVEYFRTLKDLIDRIVVTSKNGRIVRFDDGMAMALSVIEERDASGGKLIFIGNGASASIASHMAVDFWKNGKIPAISFNDSSLLTCLGNDYGFEHVFEKPIRMFANEKDVLFAISSSGKSKNILFGVSAAREKDLRIITCSGFEENNPLNRKGDINFYVPSSNYGHVEALHTSICHAMVDGIVEGKHGRERKQNRVALRRGK